MVLEYEADFQPFGFVDEEFAGVEEAVDFVDKIPVVGPALQATAAAFTSMGGEAVIDVALPIVSGIFTSMGLPAIAVATLVANLGQHARHMLKETAKDIDAGKDFRDSKGSKKKGRSGKKVRFAKFSTGSGRGGKKGKRRKKRKMWDRKLRKYVWR